MNSCDFLSLLSSTKPGDSFVYFTGDLAMRAQGDLAVDTLRRVVQGKCEAGVIHLTQRRLPTRQGMMSRFQYICTVSSGRRPWKWPKGLVGENCEAHA